MNSTLSGPEDVRNGQNQARRSMLAGSAIARAIVCATVLIAIILNSY